MLYRQEVKLVTRLEDVVSGGAWIDQRTAAELRGRYLLGRAVEAYSLMLPAINVVGLRDGSEAAFGRGYNVLPIWKDRMDSRALVPTPNADVIYSMSYLDLAESGPLVVYAPPQVIGMFTDFYQRTLTDVGAAGPDRARGGLYLILPPGYDGPVPGGYFTVRSATYNVFLFFRTVLTQGEDGPDTTQAVATAESTLIYPLGSLPAERKPMVFPNGSGRRVDMMYPTDKYYWDAVKRWVDDEPVAALPLEVRGVLATLGIIKGVPFDPAPDVAAALAEAVELAPKMIFANRMSPAYFARSRYYDDRQYQNTWGGVGAEFETTSYTDLDMRAGFFQIAYSSAPAMAAEMIGLGSKYPFTGRDADGQLLDGSNTYRLRLPAPVPARLYWAVTLYNAVDGTMPETPQLLPSINQYDKPDISADGSIEIWFSPERPDGVGEKNWIQSIPGHAQLIAVRLYGVGAEFYTQTWKPDDVVKI